VRDFFTDNEIFAVTGSPINYMCQKAILLTFNTVTEHKAQIQMMSIHNRQLTSFV